VRKTTNIYTPEKSEMMTKTKKILDKIFDIVPPGELALLTIPIGAAIFSEPHWYAFFVFSLALWILYGTVTFLLGLLLPAKFRFSLRECATRPLSSLLELLALRIAMSIFETYGCDDTGHPAETGPRKD
jgi:hypothetical protein